MGGKQDNYLQDVAHDVFALPVRSLEQDDSADPPDPGGSTGGSLLCIFVVMYLFVGMCDCVCAPL